MIKNINIVDSIMGSYKTTAAITKMNKEKENNFIFVTPYLKEVKRIKKSCADRNFCEPENKGRGKLHNLHKLLKDKENIASTHFLFKYYNEETIDIIKNNNYILILDEAIDALSPIPLTLCDFNILKNSKTISVNKDCVVNWEEQNYIDGEFTTLKHLSQSGSLFFLNNNLLIWKYPLEVFECFKESYILTYLFDAQVQKYYFDMNNVKLNYMGVEKVGNEYIFSKNGQIPNNIKNMKNRIHILEDDKLNTIGDDRNSMSSSWYKRDSNNNNYNISILKKNLYNVFRNKFNVSLDDYMWTILNDYKDIVADKRFKKGFVSINLRATNDYMHKNNLAYLSNIFLNPILKNYCIKKGAKVNEDLYSLSELVQWIWRSSIREGNDINLYIPSSRMRELLVEWLDGLADSN